jgi:ABC-2 type transport system permease protein
MRKIFLIGLKDLKLAFRDRAALILMLLAPFALTLGLGFVTGRFSGSNNTGLSDIPVARWTRMAVPAAALVELFKSPDLNGLVALSESEDPAAARRLVDENKAAAAVIIPAASRTVLSPRAARRWARSAAEL